MSQHRELIDGARQGFLLGAAVLVLVLPAARQPALPGTSAAMPPQVVARVLPEPDFGGEAASDDARRLARWALQSGDFGRAPFAIVDKRDARVFVFDATGRLRGATPVLLGYAVGDDTVAGIGQRPIADVKPEERTTPAGRFVAEPGRNALNEEVIWVDYAAAVSMHRVRLTNPHERRLERLQSPSAAERRISFGCINMPVAFFENVLWPSLGQRRAVVYVLPETRALETVFPAIPPIPSRSA